MNIGVDIDGVITELDEFQIEKGKLYFKREVVNPNGPEITDYFGVSSEEEQFFWDEFLEEYSLNVDIKSGVQETITKLRNDGHKIYIITARHSEKKVELFKGEKYKETTKNYLDKNSIPYDGLYFHENPKLDAIKDLKIDLMIEDNKYNALKMKDVTKVILMDASYNRDIEDKDIFRAYNWQEIYDIIKSLSS